MHQFIAEKPSLVRAIADALGIVKRHNGYYERKPVTPSLKTLVTCSNKPTITASANQRSDHCHRKIEADGKPWPGYVNGFKATNSSLSCQCLRIFIQAAHPITEASRHSRVTAAARQIALHSSQIPRS